MPAVNGELSGSPVDFSMPNGLAAFNETIGLIINKSAVAVLWYTWRIDASHVTLMDIWYLFRGIKLNNFWSTALDDFISSDDSVGDVSYGR